MSGDADIGGSPADVHAAQPTDARVERMQAQFEGLAIADPSSRNDDGSSVAFTLRIARVFDVQPVLSRATLPDAAGLVLADADSRLLDGTSDRPVRLRQIEILQGFDFDVASGRVTGTLLYDRVLPVLAPPAMPVPVTTPRVPRRATLSDDVPLRAPATAAPLRTPFRRTHDDWQAWRWPAFGLGSLAIALTLLVWLLRDAGRASIMAVVGLVVCFLVLQTQNRRR